MAIPQKNKPGTPGGAAAKKEVPKKQARTPWNTSEILFAVFGYLTSRKEPLIFSGHHDAAPIAEIIGKIADANNLPKSRGNFPKIHIPDGLEGINNLPQGTVNGEASSPKSLFYRFFFELPMEDQTRELRELLKAVHADRKIEFEKLEEQRKVLNDRIEKTSKAGEELLKLTGGTLIN